MRILIQRVNRASVSINKEVVGSINRGLLLFVAIAASDTEANIQALIEKVLNLRVFPSLSSQSGFDLCVGDIQAGILIISQFTLYADCSRGRRPSFSGAMSPQQAQKLYEHFCQSLKSSYKLGPVAQGVFGADMLIELENDGPVTLMLEN